MAISIISQVESATKVYVITVRLTSYNPIVDPVAYVSQPLVWMDVLAIAGLPQLLFIAAQLLDEGYIGREHFYDLSMTFDRTHVLATGHSHDSSTIFHPLNNAYQDGPWIEVVDNLGPVDIKRNATGTSDYLRVREENGDDYLKIDQNGHIQLGQHIRFLRDCEFDIGSVDGGVTLRRPRDVYICRDIFMGGSLTADGDATFLGSGTFGDFLQATHYEFTQQTVNPDSDPASRHIYWNSVDNTLRGWDGSVEFVIGGGSSPLGLTGIYSCPVAVAVGNVVSIIGGTTVDKADATILGLRPVIGVVVNKLDPTTAVVQLYGEAGVFGGILIPGDLYFLGKVPGTLTNNLAGYNTGDTIQLVGVAKDPNTLTLRFESRVHL